MNAFVRDLPGCLIVPPIPIGTDGDANVYYATPVRMKAVREMSMRIIVVCGGFLDAADNKSIISFAKHALQCCDMHMHQLVHAIQEICCHY